MASALTGNTELFTYCSKEEYQNMELDILDLFKDHKLSVSFLITMMNLWTET